MCAGAWPELWLLGGGARLREATNELGIVESWNNGIMVAKISKEN